MTTYRKKLIEVALPLPEINDASAYDKMPGIGPHPKGIHHWWARLPLPTARAILFASVVDDPSAHPEWFPSEEVQNAERERLFDILRNMMGKKLHEQPKVYAAAQAEMVKHCDGRLPIVFDPFAGGGSIPLEANRLGFETHAGDLNPVAVLLNKCNLELAPRWTGSPPVNPVDRETLAGTDSWNGTHGLAADVRYYGALVRERVIKSIGHFYPKVRLPKEQSESETNVIAWIWARTVASPNPAMQGKYVPLMSTFWLSSKAGKQAWLEPVFDSQSPDGWQFTARNEGANKQQATKNKLGTRLGKAQDFFCLLSKEPISREYIQTEGKKQRLREALVAIVAERKGGKVYLDATPAHATVAIEAAKAVTLEEARSTFLAGTLPDRASIAGGVCSAYGLSTWGHLFTARQLFTFLTISDSLKTILPKIEGEASFAGLPPSEARAYAQTITTFLGLALDRCADFNNWLCRWSPSNQKVMNLYSRQALPMVWDYAEANTLGKAVGAWSTCYEYVSDCVKVLNTGTNVTGKAHQLDAANGTNEISDLLVSTDPPYYDNIGYATLSATRHCRTSFMSGSAARSAICTRITSVPFSFRRCPN